MVREENRRSSNGRNGRSSNGMYYNIAIIVLLSLSEGKERVCKIQNLLVLGKLHKCLSALAKLLRNFVFSIVTSVLLIYLPADPL
jgi:hypothetical protein